MAWLTPPDEIGCKSVTLTMPQNAAWMACFMGALLSLTYEYNWEQNEVTDLTPAETAQKWLEIYLAIQACEGCMITDVRLTETGLEAKYCDSDDWIPKGDLMRYGVREFEGAIQFDLNGDTIFDVNIVINAPTNNYINGLAPASESAKACYAAQSLAKNIADDFKDLLELLDYNLDLIVGTIAEVSESVFGSLPAEIATVGLSQLIVASIDLAYNTTDATLEYVIPQVADPDVIDQIAEFIYCTLLKSLVTTDGITDLVDFEANLLETMGAYYVELFTFGAIDVGFGLDFGEALSDLVGASQNVIAGLACSYSLSQVYFLGSLGLKDTWKSVILGYYQEGVYFEDRDCDDYDCAPELLVNFAGEDSPVPYTVVTGSVYEYEADAFCLRKTGTGNCGSGLHCLEFVANFEEEETIGSIKIFVSSETVGSPPGEIYNCVFIVMSGATELYNDFLEGTDGEGFREFNFDITELASTDLTVTVKRGTSAGDACDFRTTNIVFNRAS